MRVILMQEGVIGPNETWPERYENCIRQAVAADELGFDCLALSEQHFATGTATTSAPEIVLAAIASVTQNIRLRIASVNFLPFNHPLRVAEQIATLDLLSGGRAELGGARSNSPYCLDAFGISAAQTYSFRKDYLNIFGQAFTKGEVEYESSNFKVPLRKVAPWPPGRRPPPIFLSVSSHDTAKEAGQYGVGLMMGFGVLGWEYIATAHDIYRRNIGEPLVGFMNNRASFISIGVSCHADRKVARDMTRQNAINFFRTVLDYYSKLSDRSPDYKYMSQIEKIRPHAEDLDWLIDSTPVCLSGNPDDLIVGARKLYDLGYDDVMWRIDGMGHHNIMQSIEMIGKYVLPELHSWPEHPHSTPASTWTRDRSIR